MREEDLRQVWKDTRTIKRWNTGEEEEKGGRKGGELSTEFRL